MLASGVGLVPFVGDIGACNCRETGADRTQSAPRTSPTAAVRICLWSASLTSADAWLLEEYLLERAKSKCVEHTMRFH